MRYGSLNDLITGKELLWSGILPECTGWWANG
jgi:hypothetical protein